MARSVSILLLLSVVLIGAISCARAWTISPSVLAASKAGRRSQTFLNMAHQPEEHHHQRRDFLATSFSTATVVASALLSNPAPSVASYIDPATDPPKITKKVYLDVSITGSSDENSNGRLVIALHGDLMPRTVDNFATLCESNAYAGTSFYRVISDLSVQGGAIGDATGKTGRSSFEGGKPFEPDNFNLKHTQAGQVSMVRGIGGSVDSRFFVNIKDEAGWADDRYAAFGFVEEGMDLINTIEKVPVSPPKNSPKNEVKIVASGVVN